MFSSVKSSLEVLEIGTFNMPTLDILQGMEKVKWLQMDHNRIPKLSPSTFEGMPSLIHCDLEGNKLQSLPIGLFRNNVHNRLNSINLANNDIEVIETDTFYKLQIITNIVLFGNKLKVIHSLAFREMTVRSLDLSNNLISHLDGNFLRPVGGTLHYLFLSYNRIPFLDTTTFLFAPNLQVLHLDGNRLSNLPNGVFQNCLMLQIIHIGHNNLSTIFAGAFRNLSSLRILDLSFNNIKTLPEDVFLGTSLERLNLSNNNIFHAPIHSLAHARSTLRYLEPVSEQDLHHSNQRTQPPSQSAQPQFVIQQVDEYTRGHLQQAGVSLVSGFIAQYPLETGRRTFQSSGFSSGSVAERHQQLDLSHNYLSEVPTHVWPFIARLSKLDISYNPIQTLSMNSFRKLEKLRELDLRGLDLKYLDARILHNLNLRRGAGRSGGDQSLPPAAVDVRLQAPGADHHRPEPPARVAGRLPGPPDARTCLAHHRNQHQQIAQRSAQILGRYQIPDIGRRGNFLTTMDEEVLSPASKIRVDGLTTQHISGGVLLEDNPWVCGCSLVWLGSWIRRWMRETLRVQMLHFDGFLYAQNLARRTVCTMPGSNVTLPLVDLDPSDFGCKLDSESNAASNSLLLPDFWLLKTASLLATIWCYSYFYVVNTFQLHYEHRTS
ncbi:chaoptin [Caerostris extrusa]|uniref:Chaoptin n=1 Tax=Caerostris extrusa TaxID=172846 RepID=A0AAV4XH04_CAEEX|nr:chaoptin [Caerostris extrusa]